MLLGGGRPRRTFLHGVLAAHSCAAGTLCLPTCQLQK